MCVLWSVKCYPHHHFSSHNAKGLTGGCQSNALIYDMVTMEMNATLTAVKETLKMFKPLRGLGCENLYERHPQDYVTI